MTPFSEHTFLVPAYKYSPHLEACLSSLRLQTLQSKILISTSTPFSKINDIAKAYNASLFIHPENKGIAHDWNKGLEKIQTPWVTIAHQDDIYYPNFCHEISHVIKLNNNPISLIFTDYDELGDKKIRQSSKLLRIKKFLLELAFLGRNEIRSKWSKVNCLRFGNPIPCPAVSLNLEQAPIRFSSDVRVNLDWIAWLKLAHDPGAFYWIRKPLMAHRIHNSSETSKGIDLGHRAAEDLSVLRTLWPDLIARLIQKTYSIAYKSNQGK